MLSWVVWRWVVRLSSLDGWRWWLIWHWSLFVSVDCQNVGFRRSQTVKGSAHHTMLLRLLTVSVVLCWCLSNEWICCSPTSPFSLGVQLYTGMSYTLQNHNKSTHSFRDTLGILIGNTVLRYSLHGEGIKWVHWFLLPCWPQPYP